MLRLAAIVAFAGACAACTRPNPALAGGGGAVAADATAPLQKGDACDPDDDRCGVGLRCCHVVVEDRGGEHEETMCTPADWCRAEGHGKEDR